LIGFASKNGFKCNGTNYNTCGYYLQTRTGKIFSKDVKGEVYVDDFKGTIIEAIFDSKKKQIKFALNGKGCKVAFTNVQESELYPAIEIKEPNASLTLLTLVD
jgi:hypothetical protein